MYAESPSPQQWLEVGRAVVPGPTWVPVNLDGCLPRALSYLETFSWNSLRWAEPG